MLPCPVCAVSLKAANLDPHLAKVHPGAVDPQPPWRGVDRRVVVSSLAVVGVALVATVAALAAGVVRPGGAAAWALVASLVALSLVGLAAAAGRMRATLSLEGDSLVLRHTFGLGRRAARLPTALTFGGLEALRPDPATSAYATDPTPAAVRAGWYLRVGDVVVGCRRSTSFPAHWDAAGWRPGARRLTCDVLVTPDVMVALEYALAARGMLAPIAG
jgi:hypothetical protein